MARERKKAEYFTVKVRGYESAVLAYQVYKDEVFISKAGRFCGLGKEIRFITEAEALEFIDKRKDREQYEFLVVKMTCWE